MHIFHFRRKPMAAKQWDQAPQMQIDPAKRYFHHHGDEPGHDRIGAGAEGSAENGEQLRLSGRRGFLRRRRLSPGDRRLRHPGGDPTGTGCGGPGYQFEDEVKNNPLLHEAKVISMANAGPNTNGSQFFITHSPPAPSQRPAHGLWPCRPGQDVVDRICQGDQMVRVTVTTK
jgi:peptidyl-prolyl cis-trans isomerase B (cyclophilin B)